MFEFRLSRCAAALAVCAGIAAAPAQGASLPNLIPVSPDQQVALGVRLSPVQAAARAQVSLPARVVVPPSRQALVSAPVAGVITHLLVNVGDVVKTGQPLVELRSAALAQLQRECADAGTQRDLTKRQLARDTALEKEGIIPTARLQLTQARARDARALLAERTLAVRLAGAGGGVDGVARILAPRDGIVSDLQVLPAQRVDQAAPLLRITAPGELWLELDANVQQAAALPTGAAVTVDDGHATGVLEARAPALGAGQTVALRARLTQPGSLVAGILVKARVAMPVPAGSWRLPSTAMTQLDGHDVALVAVPGGFRPIAVRQIARLDDAVLVTGALRPVDRVVSSGIVAIKAAAGGAQ